MDAIPSLYAALNQTISLTYQGFSGTTCHFTNVPKEIILEILQHVPTSALGRLSQTCRTFFFLTERYCQQLMICRSFLAPFDISWIKTREIYERTLDNILKGNAESFVLPDDVWKYQGTKRFLGNKMILECYSKKEPMSKCIAIWDLTNRKHLTTIQPHENESITTWGCDERERLFIGFNSFNHHHIQVWNIHTGECLHRYEIQRRILQIWIKSSFMFVVCFSKSLLYCDLLAFETGSHCPLWSVSEICGYLDKKGVTYRSQIGGLQILNGHLRLIHYPHSTELRDLANGEIVDQDKTPSLYENIESCHKITLYSGVEGMITEKFGEAEREMKFCEPQSLVNVALHNDRLYAIYEDREAKGMKFASVDCKNGNRLVDFHWPEESFASPVDQFKTFQVLSDECVITFSYNGIIKIWDFRSLKPVKEDVQETSRFLDDFSLDGEGRRFVFHDASWSLFPNQVRIVDFSKSVPPRTYPERIESENNLYSTSDGDASRS